MKRFKEPAQLHNHSKYSLLDAVPSPEEWVAWCLESGTPGFAITDHGTAISMYDAIRFPKIIEEYNKEHKTTYAKDAVIGIPAVELYVKLNPQDKGHYHITAWAVSNEGYQNLLKLSSLAYNDTVSYYGNVKGRVTFDLIKQYKKGLKFGTGCIAGPIGQAVMHDDNWELAEERYLFYKELFGDDLYVEFHVGDVTHEFNKKTGGFDPFEPTCHCEDGNKQRAYNKFLATMIDKHGGKGIPVTDAHFIKPDDKIIQDCLLKNGNDNGWYFHESYHQFTADEMYPMLKAHLGDWLTEEKFEGWIENTYEVMNAAKSINIKFEYHLPVIDIPDNIKEKTDDYNMQTYYVMMDRIKAHGRWKDDPVYVERFKKEIDVIMKNETLNFIPYFLVYEDIGAFCRSKGILQGIARGSAGGSLLSYYLKIIHVDPIKANLPFERFLSHARIRAGSFPDIDADIGDVARPLVMEYLKTKYGPGFAQIATFNKMKTKNAIKDSMFALYGKNRNDPEVMAICDEIDDSPQGVDEHDFLYGYTDKEGNYHQGEVEKKEMLANFFETYKDVEEMVKRLIGMPRGWSRHASAFVIASIDIAGTRVPTMIMNDAESGQPITVTQYEATMVEKCGLVKADILGLKTLSVVSDCVKEVKAKYNVDLLEEDENGLALVYRLPEDEDVYADFHMKRTDSSFQFNSDVIKGCVTDFAPTQREHLSTMTALMRPGAMDAPMKFEREDGSEGLLKAADFYVKVRAGEEKPYFVHADLKPILNDTYGVIVYQEQVMAVLVDICGYSLEETDIIRGAIAKKKHEVMMAAFDRIREGTAKRGWTKEQADLLCSTIMAFARYSFNRSHSWAYAELGYITMYLKNKYNLEWWASVLNNEDKEPKIRKYIGLLGDTVGYPSMKRPSKKFAVVGQKIISPVSVIKGIGPAVVEELTAKGPFVDLKDYINRVNHSKVNIGAVGALIRGRAADDLMDTGIPYDQARRKFMADYREMRASKSQFKDDLQAFDPLSIFMLEKAANKVFNKNLLSDPELINIITQKWNGLKPTGRRGIPFMLADTPVVGSVKIAEAMMNAGHGANVGMILLFEGSEVRSGVSKKSGKPYKFVSVKMSDGYVAVEGTDWNRASALKWPKNGLVYVEGELKKGWKTPISINIKEIEKII